MFARMLWLLPLILVGFLYGYSGYRDVLAERDLALIEIDKLRQVLASFNATMIGCPELKIQRNLFFLRPINFLKLQRIPHQYPDTISRPQHPKIMRIILLRGYWPGLIPVMVMNHLQS